MTGFQALIAAIAVVTGIASSPQSGTYDAVVRGMSCKQNLSGQLDCEYHVGRSLRFAIAGVGQEDAAITFFKVDVDGDFYASVGVEHGCVVVKPAQLQDVRAGFAFVSPRNGKVYRDWPACGKATKR